MRIFKEIKLFKFNSHFCTNKPMDVSAMRINYDNEELVKYPANPFNLFQQWFEDVKGAGKVKEANAMFLATSTLDGKPSGRVVLLKKVDDKGFQFFTNYESRKSQELGLNNNACITFYWAEHYLQVRIEGKVEKLTPQEGKEYFHQRPYESQLGASFSKQSSELESRQKLVEEYNKTVEENKGNEKVPYNEDFWGGWRLIPDYFEFWKGMSNRLHDRTCYKKVDESSEEWKVNKIYP